MDPKLGLIVLCEEHAEVRWRWLTNYRDFCNGFLVAETVSRYYPLFVQMHSFDNSTRYARKKDNWQQLQLIFKKLKLAGNPIDIAVDDIDALIQNTNGATLIFLKKLYTQLAQKQLPEAPRMASIKDKTAQWEGTFILKDKELVKLADQEDDFFKTEEGKGEKDKDKDSKDVFHGIEEKAPTASRKEESQAEQMKSIRLPKGPQKPIAAEILRESTEVQRRTSMIAARGQRKRKGDH